MQLARMHLMLNSSYKLNKVLNDYLPLTRIYNCES